jgi:N-acyl-D-amino-acid deacylase
MTPAQRLKVYRTPEFRREFVEQTSTALWRERYWPLMIVSYAPGHEDQEGGRLVALAQKEGATPADVMLGLSIDTDLHARFIVENPQNEDEVQRLFLTNPAVRIGNGDAGAHQGQIADYRWPTVMLSHWVRDRGLPLERAIQLMTSLGANAYGIHDRGTLTPGLAADVVVYDPDEVRDGPFHRVNDLPGAGGRLFSDGLGIEYVIVNGRVLRDHGDTVLDQDDLPGKLLRDFLPNAQRVAPPVPDSSDA